MGNEAQMDWQEQEAAPERELEERHALSRRVLFGAAGGFALAASGLLVPDWLIEEAEADNLPVRRVQQRKDHKRKRRRNQPHDNRKRRRRQDTGRGGDLFRGVQIDFHNNTFRTLDIEFWVHEPFIWRKKEGRPYSGGNFSFRTDNLEALLLIDGKFCVEVHNYPVGTPDVFLGVDGSVRERGGWHPGLTVLPPTAVSEREELPPTTVQGAKFELGRHADDLSYINFQVAMWHA